MSHQADILEVAVPCPLRAYFDYLAIPEQPLPMIGSRVWVSFGRRRCVGLVIGLKKESQLSLKQLKPALAYLDEHPSLSPMLLDLCKWAARYYHHAPGEVITQALPPKLRQHNPARAHSSLAEETLWSIAAASEQSPRLGELQKTALQALEQGPKTTDSLKAIGISRSVLRRLEERSLVTSQQQSVMSGLVQPKHAQVKSAVGEGPELNPEQQQAVDLVSQYQTQHQVFCLQGITGSGKTEVYLRLIEQALNNDQQALVLVPEIALTPQTLQRFQQRFGDQVQASHSGMTDLQRLKLWQSVRANRVSVVIGTRHAVWLPLMQLGIIIVDEEHDSAYKQQDGFRFSARDIAVKRGHQHQCPVVLGSATPSLETLYNSQQGRYQTLLLQQRAGAASPPDIRLVDMRGESEQHGIGETALSALGDALAKGEQALVFLNRRGFAPLMQCKDCGWIAECLRCDARLTVHKAKNLLRCHHCDYQQTLPSICPRCDGQQIDFRGPGTEQISHYLSQCFPDQPVVKVDRDSASSAKKLEQLLQDFRDERPGILVGTQMLAKGHHFRRLNTVITVDTDAGLLSSDFRAAERSAQLLLQVSGRAGREEHAGKVLLQTRCPDHPLLTHVVNQNYRSLSASLLQERQRWELPPTCYAAAIRADASNMQNAEQFLWQLAKLRRNHDGINWTGPLPANMARRAGRYRAILLLTAKNRRTLHQILSQLVQLAETQPRSGDLRWAVDVDPVEFN